MRGQDTDRVLGLCQQIRQQHPGIALQHRERRARPQIQRCAQAEAFRKELKVLDDVARRLRRQRMRRGALDFELVQHANSFTLRDAAKSSACFAATTI